VLHVPILVLLVTILEFVIPASVDFISSKEFVKIDALKAQLPETISVSATQESLEMEDV